MPFAAYIEFASKNRRFLSFGFLMAFSSSFGQTYFIGAFSPAIQDEFALSHTLWGGIFMAGTLVSALLLPWSGKQIDRLDLPHYTAFVCILLVLACAFTSQAGGILTLALGVSLLRLSEGLTSHVAITSMARYYSNERGRAVAIASLGFAGGEACLPLLAVFAISALGWRESFEGITVLIVLALLPMVYLLLRGHGRRHRSHIASMADRETDTFSGRSWTRAEVLRDSRFYFLLPGIMAPAMIVTALFFHHLNLADSKGWAHTWMTGSYAIFAAAAVITSLSSGPLIDRVGATKLVPYMLVSLILSMLVVVIFDGPWIVWPYLALLGLSIGLANTAVPTLWAEFYGVTHLGAIRSLAAALLVFASALGPVILGGLVDLGATVGEVCVSFALYSLCCMALMVPALRGRGRGDGWHESHSDH